VRLVKQENKNKLAGYLQEELAIQINPNSLFDVQVTTTFMPSQGLLHSGPTSQDVKPRV
jgi:hypothetical protein